jgi:hypothetical protein
MSALNGNTPAPQPSSDDDAGQESLEALRRELVAQREKRKACLERQKKTTFVAVESAKKSTTYYDPEKLRKALESDNPS